MQSRYSARRAALPFLVLGALLAGCSGDAAPNEPPPEPPTAEGAQLEVAVARKIEQRTTVVRENPSSARAWGDLGVVFDVHDLFAPALTCYAQAEKLDPGDYQWPFFQGAVNLQDDPQAARAHLERAMVLRSDYAPLSCYVGRILLEAGDLSAAREAFDRALALEDSLVAAHLGLARVDLAEGEATNALERLEFTRALDPRSTEIHALLAEAHTALGNADEAQWHTGLLPHDPEREIVFDPVRRELLLREGVSIPWRRLRTEEFLRRGDTEAIALEWTKALAIDPESAALELEAGHAMMRIGRPGDAIAHYERSIQLDPESGTAWLGRGNALSGTGKMADAIAAFEKALEVQPTLNEARVNLGALRIDSGDHEEGLALIEAACEAMPTNADARYNLARAYIGLRRREEGMDMLNEVVRMNPSHVRGHLDLGQMLMADDLAGEASEQFLWVTSLAPGMAEGYAMLGKAYERVDDPQRAMQVLAEGIEKVERNHELMYALAWMLSTHPSAEVRDGNRAIEIALEACAVTRYTDPNALQILGAAYAETGDFEKGLEKTREAEKLLLEGPLTPDRREFLIEMQKRTELYLRGEPVRVAR